MGTDAAEAVTYTILVGQAPARSSRPEATPLEGRCGERLAELAGLSGYDELTDCFAVANLLGSWPGKAGKGDLFPIVAARAAAHGMLRLLGEEEWDRVVLLGRNVASSFGLGAAPYLRWLAPTTGDPEREGRSRREVEQAWYSTGSWLVPAALQELVWPDARFAVFPHPSGVSHWWNDPKNLRAARRFLRDLAG